MDQISVFQDDSCEFEFDFKWCLSEDTKTCHRKAFFAAACFLGSQSPYKTAEIASSQKTLLAMTESGLLRTDTNGP